MRFNMPSKQAYKTLNNYVFIHGVYLHNMSDVNVMKILRRTEYFITTVSSRFHVNKREPYSKVYTNYTDSYDR